MEQFSEPRIFEKIRLFDELSRKQGKRVSKNAPGFLVASIREDYSSTKAVQTQTRTHVATTVGKALEPSKAEKAHSKEAEQALQQFEIFWNGLTDAEQSAFDLEALSRADKFSAKQYDSNREGKGSLFKAARLRILMSPFRERELKNH